MANIMGTSGFIQSGVYSRVRTLQSGIAIPGGLRTLAIVGLGAAQQTIVFDANGSGQDGLDPTFSTTVGQDGRHYLLTQYPVAANGNMFVPNRTTVSLNGIPLAGTEGSITTSFNDRYQYMFDPTTGQLELQPAHLVDQGGLVYVPNVNNQGNGTLSNFTPSAPTALIDADAPSETWIIRANSVIRDSYGDAIDGYTTFTATGSVSGLVLDAYGSPVVWKSNGVSNSNGILQFAVSEGTVAFALGDIFTVEVSSGVLSKGDTLEATYIPEANIDDPQFFVDPNALYAKHGQPALGNTLSIGASLAFQNGAFGVLTCQAAPAVPRTTTEVLLAHDNPQLVETAGFPALTVGQLTTAHTDAFMYPILSGTPSANLPVSILVTTPTGGQSQVQPNKVPFYNSAFVSNPWTSFINPATSGHTFSYTVIEGSAVEQDGTDGYALLGSSTFVAASAEFAAYNTDSSEEETASDFWVNILSTDLNGGDTSTIAGYYQITKVGDGYGDAHVVTLEGVSTKYGNTSGKIPWAGTHSNLRWQLVNPAVTAANLLFTTDLYTGGAIAKEDGITIVYTDSDDASFYDTNWSNAFQSLESVSCQMVVPLTDARFSAIDQAAIEHCELMSNTANQAERMCLIGAPIGVTATSLYTPTATVAVEQLGALVGTDHTEDLESWYLPDAFGWTKRAIFFWPDQITVQVAGVSEILPGFYMAAAAGGWLAGTANVSIPLTYKILTGFTIDRKYMQRPIILNALGNVAVSVVQPVVGGGRILYCPTTTSNGNPLDEEPSVVFISDATAIALRSCVRQFIGQPEDPTLVASMTSVVVKTLNGLVAQGLLSQYANVSVVRDTTEPRQWDISCSVYPSLPVDWIYINISVST